MRANFDRNTIEKCKELLAKAYDLESQQIDPEAIMRMAIFVSVVFAHNTSMEPEEYVDIIKDTWARMYLAIEEEPTEDMEDIYTWVSNKPITETEQ